jgi:dimethylargininase
MRYAVVRPPGRSYKDCISGAKDRGTINVDLALEQHGAYCAALRQMGLQVVALPPLEEYPDSCFVEDAAVVRGAIAVIGRFSVESRRGEEERLAPVLARFKTIRRVSEGATLEGGDVLQAGDLLFAGISFRTAWAGVEQLVEHLGLDRYRLVGVTEALHLKTLSTYLGKGTILAAETCVWLREFADYKVIPVPADEAPAANALAVGDTVLLPRGFPRTRRAVQEQGFVVRELDISEFGKGDGGLTCLSIVF